MSGSVLIVEDDRVLAEIIRFNLSRAGLDVVVAKDGQSAVELSDLRRFDLIITDYQMPKLTGEGLCEHVRSSGGPNANTPIFFCTAKGFEIDYDRLRNDLRVSRIIKKPFSPRELVAAAQEVLSTPSVPNN